MWNSNDDILSQCYNAIVLNFDNISELVNIMSQPFIQNKTSISETSLCTMVFNTFFPTFIDTTYDRLSNFGLFYIIFFFENVETSLYIPSFFRYDDRYSNFSHFLKM